MKIGFIGCGNMGGALAIAAGKCEGAEIYLYDKDEKKAVALAERIACARAVDLKKLSTECDYIFLGVKPNIIPAAISEIASTLEKRDNYCIVSMAAGVCIPDIERYFDNDSIPVIRIMPNTPAQVGAGMILYTTNRRVTDSMLDGFIACLGAAGRLDYIPERLIDAASAVSGCGPAFVYMFIEAMADGGVSAGLPRDKALIYACETVIGAAKTVIETGIHPEALKDAVCSPGGSTIEGVRYLENTGFRGSASGAVVAAYEKTLKLGK